VHTSRDRLLNRRRENRGDSPRIHERDSGHSSTRRVLEYSAEPALLRRMCARAWIFLPLSAFAAGYHR